MDTTTTVVSDDLRRLADWLDRHPDFTPGFGGAIKRHAGTVADFRAAVDALAELGKPEITYPDGYDLIHAIVEFGTFITVTVYGSRSTLCVEVPTGETITTAVVGWRLRDEVTA